MAILIFLPNMQNSHAVGTTGNALLYRLAGAKIVLVPALASIITPNNDVKHLNTIMAEYAAKLRFVLWYNATVLVNKTMCKRSDGHVPFVIPPGGSNTTGAWGYIEAFREMSEQVQYYMYCDYTVALHTQYVNTGSAGEF